MITYDQLNENDKKIVDKLKREVESNHLTIFREDGTVHKTIPLKSWQPQDALRGGEERITVTDDQKKIPSEVDLTYRRKTCKDCGEEFEGNDYHVYCHRCFDKNYSDPRERGFYHDD